MHLEGELASINRWKMFDHARVQEEENPRQWHEWNGQACVQIAVSLHRNRKGDPSKEKSNYAHKLPQTSVIENLLPPFFCWWKYCNSQEDFIYVILANSTSPFFLYRPFVYLLEGSAFDSPIFASL